MRNSLIAIAFALATTVAFAQTAPAQNPPASGANATKSSKTTTKKTKKTPKKATPSTPATTGGGAPVSK